MSRGENSGSFTFDTLFKMNVPHILEKIFFFLDYDSFKDCLKVNSMWKELLKSESYLKKGKSVFHEELLEEVERLYAFSAVGAADIVRSILSTGMVTVESVDPVDMPPLYAAAHMGHEDVVKLLLDYGALNKAGVWQGKTPLHGAAEFGRNQVVQVLIEGGADPNMGDNDGRTPLHYAAYQGMRQVVRLLLDFGADPQIEDKDGNTPINEADSGGNPEVEIMLLHHCRKGK